MPSIDTSRDRDAARTFLRLIYGDEPFPDGSQMAIWHTAPRRDPDARDRRFPTDWFGDTDSAADKAVDLFWKHSIYYGVCLHDREAVNAEVARRNDGESATVITGRQRYSRGFASTVSVVPGLWLDIDFGTEGHDQGSLPPTRDDGLGIINSLPLSPTLTVDTGGGFHAYWLFHEPLVIGPDAERPDVQRALYGWNKLARDLAEQRGWSVDSTWDLARVLRPAGTFNTKHNQLVRTVATDDGNRYDLSSFDDYAQDPPRSSSRTVRIASGDIDPNLSAPRMLLEVMLEQDAGFEQTWERRRRNTMGDDASRYELALASRCYQVGGWSDEQIVALLVQFRRERFNEGPKHAGYYELTLSRARGEDRAAQAMDVLDAVGAGQIPMTVEPESSHHDVGSRTESREVASPEGAVTDPPAEADGRQGEPSAVRDAAFEAAGAALGEGMSGEFVITKFCRVGGGRASDPTTYQMTVNGRDVDIGDSRVLMNHNQFRVCLLDHNLVLPKMKPAKWERVLRALMAVVEDEVLVEGGQEIRDAVVACLSGSPPEWPRDGIRYDNTRAVYDSAGSILLPLQMLQDWMRANSGPITQRDLAVELRAAGAIPGGRRNYRWRDAETGQDVTSKVSYWLVPWADAALPRAPRPASEDEGETA